MMNASVESFVTISRVIMKHELGLENEKEKNNNEKNIVRNKTQTCVPCKRSSLASHKMPRTTFDPIISTKFIACL
jgi:hypothetical protein